jgi:hypothetical protein
VRTLKTGRAAGRFGTVTRAHQPARYWRYVYAGYGVLAICLGLFCWVVLSPGTFR